MEETHINEKILRLTMEMIHLLTGEDYTVVKKTSGEYVVPNSDHHESGGWNRAQGLIMEHPPPSQIPERNNEQKILELIYKMVELLTGEVPIRCQDVAVYFSMEEWEYVEGHRDQYQDMMEDQRPRTSPGLPKHGIIECSPMRMNDEPLGCDGKNLRNPDISSPTDRLLHNPTPYIKQETASCEEPNPGHIQQCEPSLIKEETDSQLKRRFTDPIIVTHTNCDHYPSAHHMEEACFMGDGGKSTFMDTYRPSPHTQQYPSPNIKEEPASQEEEELTDCGINTPIDHTQYSYRHLMVEQVSSRDNDLMDTNRPDDNRSQHPTIREEPALCNGGNIKDCDSYTQHTTIKGEPALCNGGNINDCDSYTQHTTIHIKEEPLSCPKGTSTTTNLHPISGPIIYTPTDHTQKYPSTQTMEKPPDQEDLSGPDSYTPTAHTWQYPSTHQVEEPILCHGKNLTDICLSTNRLVEEKNLYNKYGYIFTEHTYTHHNETKSNNGAGSFVEHFIESLPRIVGASTSMEGFSTEERLAEIPYVSNHVRSADWCPAKDNRHNLFLSKCIEYEKHFCKVSWARICGIHLTEWSFNCSECQNCLNATLKLIRQNLKHREGKETTSLLAERQMEEKEFACPDCGKGFSKKRYLLMHRRVHGENPFHCPACGQSFENQEGFVAHQKDPLCQRPFSCSECGKRFKSRYNSEYHKKIHTENKKYLCPVCGKSFRKQSCFVVHERTHTGEKPYACSECGRCFSQSASLISHQRLHTGEKPFTCLECGRNFTQQISLVVHQRVHSGERPYKCQECGKGFIQRIRLVQHQRIHTGEKPFTCSECGKAFTLHDSLVKHLRTHTGEKPYACSECGKRFCQSSQVTAHKRFHHAPPLSTGEKVK